MTGNLISWWNRLSLREQRMLTVMFALLGAVIIWLGVWRPLTSALEQARATHEIAQIRHASVAGKVEQLRGARRRLNMPMRPANQIVGASAAEAGFTLAQVQPRSEGGIAFAIPSAKASALLAWMTALEQQGISITSFTISPSGAQGTVQTQMVVEKARP